MLLTNTPLVHDGLYGEACEHLSVTEVELCNEYQAAEHWARTEMELAAEMAVERYYEDRGYWDAREQEEVEARRGVIQFEDAYAHALGYMDAADRENAEAEQRAINAQNEAEEGAYARHREALCDR